MPPAERPDNVPNIAAGCSRQAVHLRYGLCLARHPMRRPRYTSPRETILPTPRRQKKSRVSKTKSHRTKGRAARSGRDTGDKASDDGDMRNEGVRIIGGKFRGSRLAYSGDPRTRPMKDRVREAVFNLLGPSIKGSRAVDLFSGTGAMALEAVSRGAESAVAIEQHFPSVRLIKDNIAKLDLTDRVEAVAGDAFFWAPRHQPEMDRPWTVFCCPPYDFYVERQEETIGLIRKMALAAPAESRMVVEADERFDFELLGELGEWRVHGYSPAWVGIMQKPGE
jgi:16S rRNA (guanine966-N2)-methyltransferase